MILKIFLSVLIFYIVPLQCLYHHVINQENKIYRIRRNLDNALNHIKSNSSSDIYSLLLEIRDSINNKILSSDPIDEKFKDIRNEIKKSEEKLEYRIDNILKTSNQKVDILLQAFSGIGVQIRKDLKSLEDLTIRMQISEERIFNMEKFFKSLKSRDSPHEETVKIETSSHTPVSSNLVRNFLSVVSESPQIINLKEPSNESLKFENITLFSEAKDDIAPLSDILKSLRNDINVIKSDLVNKFSSLDSKNFKNFMSKSEKDFKCSCQENLETLAFKLENKIQDLERKQDSHFTSSNHSYAHSLRVMSEMKTENEFLKNKINEMESLVSEIQKSNTSNNGKEIGELSDRLTNLEEAFSQSQKLLTAAINEEDPVVSTSTSGLCVWPFLRRAGSCFFISRDKRLNWEGARKYCKEIQGDLAAPKDFESFIKFMSDQKLSRSYTYWIGGSDIEKEDEWKWVDGRTIPVGSNIWATDQPNEGKSANCLGVRLSSRDIAALDDDCSLFNYFICEQERI